jgi:hypothetical protein
MKVTATWPGVRERVEAGPARSGSRFLLTKRFAIEVLLEAIHDLIGTADACVLLPLRLHGLSHKGPFGRQGDGWLWRAVADDGAWGKCHGSTPAPNSSHQLETEYSLFWLLLGQIDHSMLGELN